MANGESSDKRRVLRSKIFLGSTTGEISKDLDEFLNNTNICVGNYIDYKLFKLGNVYQLVFVYAELIEEKSPVSDEDLPF